MGKDAFLYVEYYGIDNYKNEGWHSFTHIFTDRPEARELYRIFDSKPQIRYKNKGVPKDAGWQVASNYTQLITDDKRLLRQGESWKYISREDFEKFAEEFLWWDDLPTRVYMDNLFDTWLTYTEVDDLVKRVKLSSIQLKLKACSSMMRVLSDGNEENARLILWIN